MDAKKEIAGVADWRNNLRLAWEKIDLGNERSAQKIGAFSYTFGHNPVASCHQI
jgi:hypothetical protein